MFLGDWYRSVIWFIQRGRRGWANCDVWSFDSYLAKVIRDGLKELRKNKTGYPNDFALLYPDDDVTAKEEWNKVLDEIIWTFDIALHIIEDIWVYIPTEEWTQEAYEEAVKHCKQSSYLFRNMGHRVLTYSEAERFEAGFDLFKKWFFAFWD